MSRVKIRGLRVKSRGSRVKSRGSPKKSRIFLKVRVLFNKSVGLSFPKTNFGNSVVPSITYGQGRNLSDDWGGGVYLYIRVMPNGFLLKSIQI